MSDKTKDQFGTYSEHVGEWTTGSGGGAGSEQTHLQPIKDEDTTIDENADDGTNEKIVYEENETAGSSGKKV